MNRLTPEQPKGTIRCQCGALLIDKGKPFVCAFCREEVATDPPQRESVTKRMVTK